MQAINQAKLRWDNTDRRRFFIFAFSSIGKVDSWPMGPCRPTQSKSRFGLTRHFDAPIQQRDLPLPFARFENVYGPYEKLYFLPAFSRDSDHLLCVAPRHFRRDDKLHEFP